MNLADRNDLAGWNLPWKREGSTRVPKTCFPKQKPPKQLILRGVYHDTLRTMDARRPYLPCRCALFLLQGGTTLILPRWGTADGEGILTLCKTDAYMLAARFESGNRYTPQTRTELCNVTCVLLLRLCDLPVHYRYYYCSTLGCKGGSQSLVLSHWGKRQADQCILWWDCLAH